MSSSCGQRTCFGCAPGYSEANNANTPAKCAAITETIWYDNTCDQALTTWPTCETFLYDQTKKTPNSCCNPSKVYTNLQCFSNSHRSAADLQQLIESGMDVDSVSPPRVIQKVPKEQAAMSFSKGGMPWGCSNYS